MITIFNRYLKIMVIPFLLVSCAKVETINLKNHNFNKVPDNIIWFQIAGLQEEHFAMLRFNQKNEESKTSFENATCIGKAWSYNLYEIRPSARMSFQSQLSSSKNIAGTCNDLSQSPFWSKFKDENYQIGVFESGANKKQSFNKYENCEDNIFSKDFIKWSMTIPPKKKGSLLFTQREFELGKSYFDPSCKKSGICFTNIQNNIQNIWSKFEKNKGRKIFIIRDYSYLNALKKKKIIQAREVLSELEKIHKSFTDMIKLKKNYLVIVTSGRSQSFEFPRKGKSWAKFEKSGRKIIYRSSSLLSPVLAEGSSSENFCGIYSESEIGQRIFWSPKTKRLKVFNF